MNVPNPARSDTGPDWPGPPSHGPGQGCRCTTASTQRVAAVEDLGPPRAHDLVSPVESELGQGAGT